MRLENCPMMCPECGNTIDCPLLRWAYHEDVERTLLDFDEALKLFNQNEGEKPKKIWFYAIRRARELMGERR